jgi:hypothetical protein
MTMAAGEPDLLLPQYTVRSDEKSSIRERWRRTVCKEISPAMGNNEEPTFLFELIRSAGLGR